MGTRRLAAIMFSDIVGYTAMIQVDEEQGWQHTQHYRRILRQYVEQHNGKVHSHQGDGSLSLFTSAIEALECARDIQIHLRREEGVAIRIGLHLGDIVEAGKDLYGDGLNIASRIESMGTPGTILISERLKYELKNHPKFKLVSLGRFLLKNVEDPMEVFALANDGFPIPQSEAMEGKARMLDVPSQTSTKSARNLLAIVGISLLTIIMLTVIWQTKVRTQVDTRLPVEIKDKRLAVLVFENLTGDSSLNAWGHLTSELLTQSFMETGKVSVVVPNTVRQYMSYAGNLPGNREGNHSFAELTGAQYLVGGTYYLEEDTLMVNTFVSNAVTGDELFQFPMFKTHLADKLLLTETIQQNLMGYWVTQEDVAISKHRVPLYEAYQWNLKYITRGGLEHLRKAVEL
ncbi:MAG: adenylate/guanylate cyclase domain-containing protein, partial [Saprospiraceae bacterium]|nr:adenylate/guanylate cyclase domain-containing protein [Saprospiraceae bacterium]